LALFEGKSIELVSLCLILYRGRGFEGHFIFFTFPYFIQK
jgi:hypothetical protein